MRSHFSLFSFPFSPVFLGLFFVTPLVAQQPTPQQIQQGLQQAQTDPAMAEAIRQRLRQSGMTPDQIRSRLQSMGYSSDLLNQFMGDSTLAAAGAVPNDQMLRALSALGVGPVQAQGLSVIPVDTGLQQTARPNFDDSVAAAARAREGKLGIFGAQVFRGTTTQFQPQLSGPVPPSYRVGPGDVMVVVLTGDVEAVHTLEVTREGFVVIPQVGQIYVGNLTMEQMRSALRTRLGRSYSGIRTGTTRFDVTIARLRTNQITVVGDVMQPGAFQLAGVATVLNALYAAGGPTDRGNFRQIEVRRNGEPVATFDLYDYLLRGDTRNDIILQQGDVVFVPVHSTRARLTGAVTRPAIYELKPGQNLSDLIEAGGGFREDAALARVSVHRILPASERTAGTPVRTVIDVHLSATSSDSNRALRAGVSIPPFPVVDGDSVVVDSLAASTGRNYADIQGNVYVPGRYGLARGMTLSRLVALAGGLRPATYAGRAHIERLNLQDSTRFVLPAQLPSTEGGPWTNDPTLQEYDIITIYGREEFREARTIRIAGMVNNPGVYQYRNGMTLRDLILMARGLADGAYLDTVEIDRLPEDRAGGRLATSIRVSLDSTYLFEPDATTYKFLPGLPAPRSGAPEVPLEPYDQVLVWKQQEFEFQRNVDIVGEVRFPATYALQTKSDRLSDVVKRAGGLLPTAYGEGSRFVRTFGNAGRVDINLLEALRRPGSRFDPIMQPGDSIFVPEFIPTVRVEGGVNSPTSVLFREGAGLDYYIDNAGGFARTADKGRVSVRYANGSARTKSKFLFWNSSPSPGPGSVVVVPTKPDERNDVRGLIADITQIIATVATVIIVAVKT